LLRIHEVAGVGGPARENAVDLLAMARVAQLRERRIE
jgi:hypothetical protein